MSALTILIIWHAEKQGEFWPGSDLMPDEVPTRNLSSSAVGNGLAAGPPCSVQALAAWTIRRPL
jgi:hypothetical protein